MTPEFAYAGGAIWGALGALLLGLWLRGRREGERAREAGEKKRLREKGRVLMETLRRRDGRGEA
jgi:hypothetical protein